MSMMSDGFFQDKVAVVTGAASGIGLATTEMLARAGATVVMTDIDVAKGETESARLSADGLSVSFVAANIADDDSVAALVAAVTEQNGGADMLVNVAGYTSVARFMETLPENWQKVVEINYLGVLRTCQALIPGMISRGGGSIVNVASDAARVGSPNESVYAGAKGAVVSFGKSIAREVARFGITVNNVCPGPTDTPMLNAVRGEQEREALVKATPMRRLGTAEDVAGAVCFFCGPQARFITGQTLSVSGGLTTVG